MYITELKNITKSDVGSGGGKGANLGELVRLGAAVPGGAVLVSGAYDSFMEHNRIDTGSEPSAVREAILGGCFPDDIEQEISAFYRGLGADARVAVRSSATAEDLEEASFAGQQETYLNVVGEEMLLAKIKECYASLWGDRAVSYRRNQGYDKMHVSIAVVIQLMIECDKAGVLFTADPSGANVGCMLINGAYGLGESVVSGMVTPDEYVCDKSGALVKATVGCKDIKVVYGERGTQTVPVAEELKNARVLSDGEVKALAEQAVKIEKHYGAAMDIEWGIADGRVYILQARRITALGEQPLKFEFPPVRPVPEAMREKAMFNLEKMPFAYYPLDYSFSMLIGEQRAKTFQKLGMTMGGECTLDEDGVMRLPEPPKGPPPGVQGGPPPGVQGGPPPGMQGGPPQGRPPVNLGQPPAEMPTPPAGMAPPKEMFEVRTHVRNAQAATAAMNKCHAEFDRIAAQDIGGFTLDECRKAFDSLREIISEAAFAKFMYSILPTSFMDAIMRAAMEKAKVDIPIRLVLSGLNYKTAEINRDMEAIAAVIRNNGALSEAILRGDRYEEIIGRFPDIKPLFEGFLKKHGFKADYNCYCLISRSWNEDPQRFLQVLTPMLGENSSAKAMDMESGQQRYHDILDGVRNALSEEEYNDFKAVSEACRVYHFVREDSQYLFESCFEICRRIYNRVSELVFGEYTTELMYLFYNELCEVLETGALSESHMELIARRKAKRPYAEAYWEYQKAAVMSANGDKLKGICGSTGTASGRVCIITEPSQFGKLRKGEILVCRYTAPEWTPLFTLAAAVVSDTGGSLSHAAVVAREYGIPAVLGVGNATSVLKDGDMVTVNGSLGEVNIIE